MTFYCSIPFEQNLWKELNSEANSIGQIRINNDINIQLMPVDEFHFSPEINQIIEVIFDATTSITLGIISSWLYDKLKQRNIKSIDINGTQYSLKDQPDLENAIYKESNKND